MPGSTKITRDDLEAKLRQVVGEVDDRVEEARPRILTVAVVAVVAVAVVAYLFGRRSGKMRSAVVEIRRL